MVKLACEKEAAKKDVLLDFAIRSLCLERHIYTVGLGFTIPFPVVAEM